VWGIQSSGYIYKIPFHPKPWHKYDIDIVEDISSSGTGLELIRRTLCGDATVIEKSGCH
jgi:hypothetical protein